MESIAVLLSISFALFVLARITRKQVMFSVLYLLGMAVWSVAFLECMRKDRFEPDIVGFLLVLVVLSELIAIPIAKRRIVTLSLNSVFHFWNGCRNYVGFL
jgi:hypothetical protein